MYLAYYNYVVLSGYLDMIMIMIPKILCMIHIAKQVLEMLLYYIFTEILPINFWSLSVLVGCIKLELLDIFFEIKVKEKHQMTCNDYNYLHLFCTCSVS